MRTRAITASTQPTNYVIATQFKGTRAALEAAIPLARGSRARLMVLVPQIVPYALSLDDPGGPAPLAAERYRHLLHQLHGEAEVRLCRCRHVDHVIQQMLPSQAMVVVGGPAGTWRASGEEQLARRLTHLGYRVVFAPIVERPSAGRPWHSGYPEHGLFNFRGMGCFLILAAVVAAGLAARAAFAQAPTNRELMHRVPQVTGLTNVVNVQRVADEPAHAAESEPDAMTLSDRRWVR